ncbi:HAD-IIIA family hydrolase [Acidobacteriota bacterium]
MKAVIIAGGSGSRLKTLTGGMWPKSMLKIGSKPLLEHQLELFAREGIKEIVICAGHGWERIKDYFGSGDGLGISLTYSVESRPLGTAGAFGRACAKDETPVFVLYGDILVNMDLRAFTDFHESKGGLATLAVHPNDHMVDSDLLELDENARISRIHMKPHDPYRFYPNLDNCGFYILDPHVSDFIPDGSEVDFAHDVFPRILESGKAMFGYRTAEYLKDMGTPERFEEVNDDWQTGKVQRSHRSKARPAVFLDRDGVLVQETDHLHAVDRLELLPSAAEAVNLINRSDFLAVLITNQSVIARGMCTESDLRCIHNKLETLLGRERAWLDGIYYCPHHPEFEYKGLRHCPCRKPGTGMVEDARKDFNIDLGRSSFIGDTTRDAETARRSGILPLLVKTGYAGQDDQFDAKKVAAHPDVLSAVRAALQRGTG